MPVDPLVDAHLEAWKAASEILGTLSQATGPRMVLKSESYMLGLLPTSQDTCKHFACFLSTFDILLNPIVVFGRSFGS